jgi:hypothetical protein
VTRGGETVQVCLKLVERTPWVQIPTGERVAALPEPNLAGGRATAILMRRQGVRGPMCASLENFDTAVAETFIRVEGNTGPSAKARTVGAAGVYGIGTGARVRLQPGRPRRFPGRTRVGGRKGDRSAR